MKSHLSAALAVLILPALSAGLRSQGKATVSSGTGYRVSQPQGDACSVPHVDDLYRPIKQVAREHPGEDLNCWFHFYADYLGNPADFKQQFYDTIMQYSMSDGRQGPERKLHVTTGEVLTTHDDNQIGRWGNFAYDDTMCYEMGWMKGQGHLDDKLMSLRSPEEWNKVAQAECERMQSMVHPSLVAENSSLMTIGYMQDDNQRVCDEALCLWEDYSAPCRKPTLTDWVVHLYPKCLLGPDDKLTGAAGQIAWCFARGCVTEGGVIKHGAECWPDGLPNLWASSPAVGIPGVHKTPTVEQTLLVERTPTVQQTPAVGQASQPVERSAGWNDRVSASLFAFLLVLAVAPWH